MLKREEMYRDIVAAKAFISEKNNEYGDITPTEWIEIVHCKNGQIRYKIALLTVLYTGHWMKIGWDDTQFMMPATRDCIEQYPNVKKNLGKEVVCQHYHYEEDEPEWEGFIDLFFRNFRKKKTA